MIGRVNKGWKKEGHWDCGRGRTGDGGGPKLCGGRFRLLFRGDSWRNEFYFVILILISKIMMNCRRK